MWADGLSPFLPGGPSAVDAWASAFVTAARSSSPRVDLRVESEHSVVVSVDLYSGADATDLIAEHVGNPTDAKVKFREGSGGVVRVDVSVPENHAEGLHRFTIRDRSGCQRGTVSIDVVRKS